MQTDVLIIGGGLTGCAAAYFLAEAGIDVLVAEQAYLNSQASGANAGSIHAQIPHRRFMAFGEDWARHFGPSIPLLLASIHLWGSLAERLGEDLEFATLGGLLVAETEAEMNDLRRKAAVEREFGLQVEILGRNELRALAPYVSPKMAGGAFCPVEGKANPLLATHAFARAAARRGARFLENRRILALERQSGGFAIATNDGPISARRVLNCAGAEVGVIAKMLGIDLPVQAHPIQVCVTERLAPLVPHLVYFAGERLTLKQAKNGAILIGGGWPAAMDAAQGRPVLDLKSVAGNASVAAHVIPALDSVRIIRCWPALVNGTEDWKPILGEVPRVPGFFLAMFPWMGFTAGPIAARLVADLMCGRDPGCDLSVFSPERYG